MATIRLVPSKYAVSSTSYLSVSNAENMYTNTDSTTYATITNTYSSTSSRYLYLRGFNFDDIPSGATINSFTVKIKGYESGLATSTSYAPRLANGTSALSGTTASSNFGTSTTTITIPTGSLTWQQISSTYGSDFTIMVYVRRASRNTTGYFYCYGAEIEVDYTVPVTYNVTVTNSTSATVTANPTSVLEGSSSTIISDTLNNIIITDNNVNVTNQFVLHSGTTGEYSIENRGTYGFALNNNGYYQSQNAGVDKTCAVCRISFNLPVTSTITFQYINYAEATYDFGVFGNVDVALTTNYYPAGSGGATISETSYKKACNTSSDNTSSVQTLTYSNVSAGEHFIDVKYSKDDASSANNDTLQFKVTITYSQSVSYYSYTISNITTDHAIVVSSGGSVVHVTGVSLDQHTASVQAGQTVQLTATVSPNNATDKSVSWSSNNTSVATVNSSGLVTAVSAGTATITVTTTDGSYTDTCVVTVTAAVTYDYKLAASTVVGKKYLIANGNTGTVYLLTNESGGSRQLVGMSVTVSNGRISLTAAQKALAEFECVRYTSGNDNTITMKSDNKYLYTDNSSGLRMNAPTTLDRFWHYRDNKFWQFKSTTSDGYEDTSTEYKYYLQMTGTNFTDNHVTSPSISETDIPAIYIFVEDDGTTEEIYVKQNGTWVQYSKVYKKINGAWIEQADISSVFSTDANYVKAN